MGRRYFTVKNVRNSARVIESEDVVHESIIKYLKWKYPNVIFKSEYWAGMKQSYGALNKAKRMGALIKNFPDLFIAEPRSIYHGCFIELKRAGTRLYKKDGTLVADKHIKNQSDALDRFRERGYYAAFAVGFEEARLILDRYLAGAL